MASPPFSINEALPGDNDIVSQHPTGARTFRDQTESWLKWNHNVNGRHDEVELDVHADGDYAGVASVTTIWASSAANEDGTPKYRKGTGAIGYVSEWWPGDIKISARTADHEGWLLMDNRNVSRATFARLFAQVGVLYGAGDGSTTFGIGDMRGYVPAGVDVGSLRLDSLTTNGAVFGSKNHALSTAELAQHLHAAGGIGADANGTHHHKLLGGSGSLAGAASFANSLNEGVAGGDYNGTLGLYYEFDDGDNPAGNLLVESSGNHTHTTSGNSANTGSGTAHNNVQPTRAVNFFIKT